MPKYPKPTRRTVVSPGKYEVQVVGAKNQISQNGNEMIVLRISVAGAARLFSDHLVFTESSLWKIADFLTAMGEEADEEHDIEPGNYLGRVALAKVGVEEYNGRAHNKIEKWLPPITESEKADRASQVKLATAGDANPASQEEAE